MNWLKNFLIEEEATTAVEYAVMLALILAVIIGSINSFGGATGGMFGNINDEMVAAGM